MSLEAAIEKLTASVDANSLLLQQVLAADAANGGDASETKPKRTTKPKEDAAAKGKEDAGKADAATSVPDDLKKAIAAWLGEFAKEEDKANPDGAHPEVVARKAALKKAFEGLGVAKLPEINTAEGVTKLTNWFEKAKAVDKGHGTGRFVADPAPAGDDDEDDGLGV